MKKGPFKMRGFSGFKDSPAKIDLTRKKTVPMEGAPGGDDDYKPGQKKIIKKKKTLVSPPVAGPKVPKTQKTKTKTTTMTKGSTIFGMPVKNVLSNIRAAQTFGLSKLFEK